MPERLFEHEIADADDQAAILGNWNENARSDIAQRGMVPANQHLPTAQVAGGNVDERLECELELLAMGAQ
jgi:hypothetical protein